MQDQPNRRTGLRVERVRLKRDAVIIGGIALNVLLPLLVQKLGLPVYLDTVGTVFTAWACGPLPAILTALASNILCISFSRMSAYFVIVNICIAISASRMIFKDVFKRRGGFALFALTLALIGGVLGGLIAWGLNTVISVDFVSVPFVDRIVGVWRIGRFPALMLMNLALNLADKFITAAICCRCAAAGSCGTSTARTSPTAST